MIFDFAPILLLAPAVTVGARHGNQAQLAANALPIVRHAFRGEWRAPDFERIDHSPLGPIANPFGLQLVPELADEILVPIVGMIVADEATDFVKSAGQLVVVEPVAELIADRRSSHSTASSQRNDGRAWAGRRGDPSSQVRQRFPMSNV